MEIIGTTKPMAAVNCIVNPHMSKAMVAKLANIVLQKPHFRLVNKPETATSPKTPKNRNIPKSVTDVPYEMGASKNCPIPSGVPITAKQAYLQTELSTENDKNHRLASFRRTRHLLTLP